MRIEWVGLDDVPEEVRRKTEAQIEQMAEECGRMRAMELSVRRVYGEDDEQIRLSCTCSDRTRCLAASRSQIEEGLEAFCRTLRAQCDPPS